MGIGQNYPPKIGADWLADNDILGDKRLATALCYFGPETARPYLNDVAIAEIFETHFSSQIRTLILQAVNFHYLPHLLP